MTIQGQAFAGATTLGLPVEIAFLSRHGVPPRLLKRAAAIAEICGVTADRALLGNGLLDEAVFYRALADELNVPFLDSVTADPKAPFPDAVRTGLATLAPGSLAHRALAPEGAGIARLLARRGDLGSGVAIAAPSELRAGIMNARARSIARRAANALPDALPHLSYRDFISFPQIAAMAFLAGPIAFVATLAFEPLWVALMTVAGLAFLAMTAMRLSTVLKAVPIEPERPPPRRRSRDLPVYTVVVPLYREWRVLPRLVAALSALDYPGLR